jgi:hypothetical protein
MRFAPPLARFVVSAVAAALLTATVVVAQTPPAPPTLTPPAASGAPGGNSAPPAVTTPGLDLGPDLGVSDQGRRGERRQGRAAMGACRVDMQSLCGAVERGKGNKMRCLIENRTKASSECQTALAAVEAGRAGKDATKADRRAQKRADRGGERGGRMAACRADTKALCADVERGGGRKIACLRANEAKLTPDCAGALKSLPVRPNKG